MKQLKVFSIEETEKYIASNRIIITGWIGMVCMIEDYMGERTIDAIKDHLTLQRNKVYHFARAQVQINRHEAIDIESREHWAFADWQ